MESSNGHSNKKRKGDADGGLGLLDDIETQMNKNIKEKKEHAVKSNFKKLSTVDLIVASCMQSGIQEIPEESNQTVEIEFRFGRVLQDGSFSSGIRKQEYNWLLQQLQQYPQMKSLTFTEIDYIFKAQDENRRVIHNVTQDSLRSDIKHRFHHAEYQTVFMNYDMRLSMATETTLEEPAHIPENPSRKREKHRRSFFHQELPFRIDMTEVKDNDNTTFELEFEFSAPLAQYCRKGAESDVRHIIRQFYSFITNLTQPASNNNNNNNNNSNNNDIHQSSAGISLTRVDHALNEKLRFNCVSLIPGLDAYRNHRDFPGSMPVNFSRAHIPQIQQSPYFISEKTDGVRYFMYVDQSGVYMTSRKFDFFTVDGFESLVSIYGHGCSLLDGEMVKHHPSGNPMFLIFDIICLNGNNVASEPLHNRLKQIAAAVELYRAGLRQGKIPEKHPFPILGKPFREKRDIRKLFQSIKTEGNERYYHDDKRHHKTDGIILTPDEPYHAKTVPNLFKWKYIDKLSIDLKVRISHDGHFSFCCMGNDGGDIPYDIKMKREDQQRLYADIQRMGHIDTVIAECSYDHWVGAWCYQMIRTDKNKPNHIRVVFSTLEVCAENVSKEEICYRVPITDIRHDDWKSKVEHSMQQILEGHLRQQHH